MALCLFANPLIIEKMVIPTSGSLEVCCINVKIMTSVNFCVRLWLALVTDSYISSPLIITYKFRSIDYLASLVY